jgi:hypothetical protein
LRKKSEDRLCKWADQDPKNKAMKTILLTLLLIAGSSTLPAQLFIDNTDHIPITFTAASTMDVETLDVDADGDPDLILAMEFSENILLINDGNGVFSIDPDRVFPEWNTTNQQTGEDSEDIGIADFDQDGDQDVLFVSEDSQAHELLFNDGNGKFTFAPYQFPSSVANALAIIDLNEDEAPDVIIGNKGQNQVYLNQGDGTFTEVTADRWPSNSNQTQDLKKVDIDQDGDLDIVEGVELGGNNIYLNQEGYFTAANDRLPDFNAVIETRKVEVADVDGDGDPDLFYCNVGWVPLANLQNRLLLNDGNGFFEDVTFEALPIEAAFTLDAVFMDLNQDDALDLITTGLGAPGTTHKAYFNDGEGHFTEVTDQVFPEVLINNGIGLKADDLNGDGNTDLYFSNHSETDRLFFFQPTQTSVNNQVLDPRRWLKCSPNPATDTLIMEWPDGEPSGSAYIQFNGMDQHRQVDFVQFTDGKAVYDLQHLPAGVYSVSVNVEGAHHSCKIVKQ